MPGPATEVTGAVLVACPQGRYIRIKTEEGRNLDLLSVINQAQAVVKGLKKGDRVRLTCVRCPKTGATVVVKVEKVVR